MSAGRLIVLPPNVPHSFVALEATTDLDFFSPPHVDWERGDEGYFRGGGEQSEMTMTS